MAKRDMKIEIATPSNPLAEQAYTEGLSYLRQSGIPQDLGMAAAKLLDASDLNHPEAHIYCALMYFCGVGVARNIQYASEYAKKYALIRPAGDFLPVVGALLDGTIGTENARNILFNKDGNANQIGSSHSSKKSILIAAAVLFFGITVVAFLMLSGTDQQIDSDDISAIALDKILSPDDVKKAKKQALSTAATLYSDAQILIEEDRKKNDAEAHAKAAAEELEKEHFKVEAEAKARAEVDAAKAHQQSQNIDPAATAGAIFNGVLNNIVNIQNQKAQQKIQPSFDCGKARSVSEKIICSDADLAAKDNDLFELYKRAKIKTNNSVAFVSSNKESWLYRERNCQDKTCLMNWYNERSRFFINIINSN